MAIAKISAAVVIVAVSCVAVWSPAMVAADTPANCSYDDVVGQWTFQVSGGGKDSSLNCTEPGPVDHTVTLDLTFPDVAVDLTTGHRGHWTLVYNQGFEVVINFKKYFAFSKFVKEGDTFRSICSETMPGWSHNVVGKDWACYVGKKMTKPKPTADLFSQLYRTDYTFINKINSAQSSWKAGAYPEYEKMTIEEMIRRRGGRASVMAAKPHPAPVTEAVRKMAASLPASFDWRDVDGESFVSPVRNQGQCGSCYAFGSMGMLEARLRIMTNNSKTPVLSTQDVVSCSKYSQGCEGGFPYLIAGKYAEDFGVVEESCFPYMGKDGPCKASGCERIYATGYSYVGGFYGGCNEELMRIQLVKNGPLAVSFEVYRDFEAYRGGIYHHVASVADPGPGFDPFRLTNHAVLAVGYGADSATGEKFWIIKNSWGEGWGENGFFRIRRGTDECSIESIAVESFPIYP